MKIKSRLRLVFAALCVLSLAAASAAFCFGSSGVSVGPLALGSASQEERIILLSLRLPRLLAAGLAGIGLSVSGLLLQTVTGNGLCAPNIIGVNAGSGFAVILLLCAAPAAYFLAPAAAFAGALLTTLLAMSAALSASGNLSKTAIVLSGVAISSIFSAATSFLILRFPDAAYSYSAFSVGGFRGVGFRDIALPSGIIAACVFLAFAVSGKLQLMLLGDDVASSLGINVRLLRLAAVVLASALASAVVSYAGLLGFVGLAVPHISRLLVGQSLRRCIPACCLLGFPLVIAADLLGRVLAAPSEIPAGIVTALLGAPFFLYLLLKRRYSI